MSQEAPPPETTTPEPAATPASSPAPSAAETRAAPPRSAGRGESALPPEAPAPSTAAAEPEEIHPDVRKRVLESLSDDELKSNPSFRDRYNRFVSGEKKRLEAENQKQRAEAETYMSWDAYFRDLERDTTGQRLYMALNDPVGGERDTQAYAVIKRWRKAGGNTPGSLSAEEIATQMVTGLQATLKEEEHWADLSDGDWNEIFSDRDVKKVLARLVVAGTEKERKSLRAQAKAEIEAGINDALTKRNLSVPGAEPPHGAVVTGGNGGLTLEQYNAMSPSERRVLRRDHPQEVDAMTSALLEASLAGPGT